MVKTREFTFDYWTIVFEVMNSLPRMTRVVFCLLCVCVRARAF